jgi:hypothetical protein
VPLIVPVDARELIEAVGLDVCNKPGPEGSGVYSRRLRDHKWFDGRKLSTGETSSGVTESQGGCGRTVAVP